MITWYCSFRKAGIYILPLAKYQGVAPGFNGWEIYTFKKLLKIQNGIFEHRYFHPQKNCETATIQ